MPVGRITKRSVDALQPSARDVLLWDEDLRGFGVLVTPKGHKSYVVQYRIPGLGRRGLAKRIVLGSTYGGLTPDTARQLARRELGKVAHGADPAADRAARREAATMEDLGHAYLEDIEARHKKSTVSEYGRLWRKHVAPALGTRQVAEIASSDIRRVHRSLSKTPYVANRVLAMLGAFFTYAAKEGIRGRHDNPAHEVEFYPEKPRERFLTPKEFGRLGEALARAERDGLPPAPNHKRKPNSPRTAKHRPMTADTPIPANPFGVAAIRLLALTGCRENEILSLRWDAVDLERGYLRLSDTKTGKSNRPLSQTAASIIEALPRVEGNPHVLPGAKPGQHVKEIKRLWYAVRHAAKLDDVRLHDLRHSYASVPATSGESMLVLKTLLGHKRVATTERYAHLGDDPVRRAADRAAHDIAHWMRKAAV
ncbi:MAG: tyrosine-type recombinase/integrase [Gemmatimonadaceae bacterium]